MMIAGRKAKYLSLTLFLILLIPSANIAWRNRTMPQFGRTHDDAIHYISAKSLAEGHGYRILNMPGAPFETKYPPMLPWLFAAIIKIDPAFPKNLQAISALQWGLVPILLWMSLVWFRRSGLTASQTWIALGLVAVSPYTVAMGSGIHTEMLFTIFLLASVVLSGGILCRKPANKNTDWRMAAVAGILAGLAYLTRSAGLVALISFPLSFLMAKRRQAAFSFSAGMLPFVVSWMAWARLHKSPTTDLAWIYNTDYLAFQFINVHTLKDLGLVIWKNLGFVPDNIGRPELLPYLTFGIITLMELVVWHYPPNLRFMYPLVPLFAVGAVKEGAHILEVVRLALSHKDSSQRVAAWGMAGAAVIFCVASLASQAFVDLVQMPIMIREDELGLQENLRTFDWVAQNTAPNARILANNPALYLYTGRQIVPLVIPTIHWYREDDQSMISEFRNLSSYIANYRLDYVLLREYDYQAIMNANVVPLAHREVVNNPTLRLVSRLGTMEIFEARQFSALHPLSKR